MAIEIVEESKQEMEKFFHKCGGIVMYPKPVRRLVADGVAITDDGPMIQFAPCGSRDAGMYVTKDPELIKYLRERGDVMNEQEFLEWSRTPEQRLQQAESQVEMKDRTIQEQNKLIKDLEQRLNKSGKAA
jgi:hypothetical protein